MFLSSLSYQYLDDGTITGYAHLSDNPGGKERKFSFVLPAMIDPTRENILATYSGTPECFSELAHPDGEV